MQPWKILTKLLLITLLALSASGVVSAKVASGLQNLSPGLHQGETVFNPLTHRAKIDFSTTPAPGSPVVTKGLGKPKNIPKDWISKSSKKGGGTQYINPKNSHDRVRVMQGNPKSPNSAQQKPYVKRQIDGKFYDKSGNVVPGDSPGAHIPLKDFKF